VGIATGDERERCMELILKPWTAKSSLLQYADLSVPPATGLMAPDKIAGFSRFGAFGAHGSFSSVLSPTVRDGGWLLGSRPRPLNFYVSRIERGGPNMRERRCTMSN